MVDGRRRRLRLRRACGPSRRGCRLPTSGTRRSRSGASTRPARWRRPRSRRPGRAPRPGRAGGRGGLGGQGREQILDRGPASADSGGPGRGRRCRGPGRWRPGPRPCRPGRPGVAARRSRVPPRLACRPAGSATNRRAARQLLAVGGSEARNRSVIRTHPMSSDVHRPGPPSGPGPTTSSVEPPPMSTTSHGPPAGSSSAVAPANDRRPSSSPASSSGRTPTTASAAAEEVLPVGGVARRRGGGHPHPAAPRSWSMTARYSRRTATVRSIAAGASRRCPVDPWPSRVIRMQPLERSGRSGPATSSRVELVPQSMAADGRRLGSTVDGRGGAPPSARPGRRRRPGTRRSGRGGTSRPCRVPPTPPDGRGPVQPAGSRRRAPRRSAAWAAASSAGSTAASAARTPPGGLQAVHGQPARPADQPVAGRHGRAVVEQRGVADHHGVAAGVADHHREVAPGRPPEQLGHPMPVVAVGPGVRPGPLRTGPRRPAVRWRMPDRADRRIAAR